MFAVKLFISLFWNSTNLIGSFYTKSGILKLPKWLKLRFNFSKGWFTPKLFCRIPASRGRFGERIYCSLIVCHRPTSVLPYLSHAVSGHLWSLSFPSSAVASDFFWRRICLLVVYKAVAAGILVCISCSDIKRMNKFWIPPRPHTKPTGDQINR